MKMRLQPTLTLGLVLLSCLPAMANHIVGGYMRYTCLGNDNYQFELIVFRDCDAGGAPFDSDPSSGVLATVSVFQGNEQVPSQVLDLDAPFVDIIMLPSSCYTLQNQCFERGTYVFDLEIPASNLPTHIVYQRCCRGLNYSNIDVSETQGNTFTISLTPSGMAACNTSPLYVNPPMFCSNITDLFSFDHSFSDAEGDSLSYGFCAPITGGGDNTLDFQALNGVAPNPDAPPPFGSVSFSGPNSASQPIYGNPPFAINAATGEVTGKPITLGSFLYAVCVKEYRNGVLLSETQFEFVHEVGFSTPATEIASGKRALTFELLPNPASDFTTVRWDATPGHNAKVWLKVIRADGALVQVAELDWSAGSFQLTTSDWPTGMYAVTLMDEVGSRASRRLVVLRE